MILVCYRCHSANEVAEARLGQPEPVPCWSCSEPLPRPAIALGKVQAADPQRDVATERPPPAPEPAPAAEPRTEDAPSPFADPSPAPLPEPAAAAMAPVVAAPPAEEPAPVPADPAAADPAAASPAAAPARGGTLPPAPRPAPVPSGGALAPGTPLDNRYEVVQLIGKGAMASVYQVKHLGLGSVHALKVLHAELAQDPDLRTRFLAEGQIQAQLKHQNIVHVTEIVTNPVAGLVMDFVDGQSLDGWLRARSKPLTLVEMLELFLPVLDALGAAHRFGVVHRDLKPENILVGQGPEGRPWPRVTDFGIAKVASQAQVGAARRTQAGTRMGTLLYMSPEQVRGAPDLDSRSDVFALGAILYELVTGKVAFDRHTEFETMKAIVAADYVPPEKLVSGLPAPLLGVIRRALAVEPSHRFADTALFRSALEGVPLPARAQTLWPTRATQPPTQPPMSGGQAWGVGAPVARPTVKYPPPQAQPRAAAPALRSNHLGVAMLSMLFFCFPVGLVATVYALRVMPALELGDGALAASHASKARSWAAAAVAAGTAVWSLMGWHFFHS